MTTGYTGGMNLRARTTFPSVLSSVSEVLQVLARGQTRRYSGEPVTHWEHALQTASLALAARAPASLVTAALLHDIGHLLDDVQLDSTPSAHGIDDRHELAAARALAPLFGEEVIRPIALHVQAKRYLVATSADYARRLSEDSLRSLALQGGPMSEQECHAFIALPHVAAALQLRCWDDLAKDPALPAQDLARFRPALERCALP